MKKYEEENYKYEPSVEITFTIYDEDEATFTGSISIQAETAGSGSETVVYSAVLNEGSVRPERPSHRYLMHA